MRVLLFLFLCFSSGIACGSDQSYHCKFPLSKHNLSSFDKMIRVYSNDSGQRVLVTGYFGDKTFIKTIDLGDTIISIYEDRTTRKYNPSYELRSYQLFYVKQIDMSSEPVRFNYGYAYHDNIKYFEKLYRVLYTEQNFKAINRSPEIIQYLPAKEHADHISWAFWSGDPYPCEGPLNFFENRVKRFFLFFHYLSGAV